MAKVETVPFDTADFINSADDAAAYLDAYLEDGTPEELRTAIETIARSRGMSELSRSTGISRAGLYKALGTSGNPSLETIRAILSGLGLRLSIMPIVQEAKAA